MLNYTLFSNLTAGNPLRRIAAQPEIRMLGWNVPPEELPHIPQHWLSYPEPEASMHYLLGLLYIFFTIISLIGNGLVMWVFST